MKKHLFVTLSFFLILLLVPFNVHAVSFNQCSPVNEGNYSNCCTGFAPQGDADECAQNAPVSSQSDAPETAPTTTQQSNTNSIGSCSASTISNSSTYEVCCSGVRSQDSTACQNYAVNYIQQTDPSNPQCAALGPNNLSQCCPGATGNNSPMCVAYAATTHPVPGQVNSAPSGTIPTNALNNGASTSNASSAQAINPAVASCSAIQFTTLLNIAVWIKCLITAIVIPGIFTLAFVVFLWGILKFMRADAQKDKDESKQYIYVGLIGLFVMVSVWGILKILATTFGISTVVPTLQTDYLKTPSSTSDTAVPSSVIKGTTN